MLYSVTITHSYTYIIIKILKIIKMETTCLKSCVDIKIINKNLYSDSCNSIISFFFVSCKSTPKDEQKK